jgi:hypothetical protein
MAGRGGGDTLMADGGVRRTMTSWASLVVWVGHRSRRCTRMKGSGEGDAET